MGKKSFKGRIVNLIKREQSYVIKVPSMKNQERSSLKGRAHALPKDAFWHRVGSWPFEEEKFVG
jgi:hypothetical protein